MQLQRITAKRDTLEFCLDTSFFGPLTLNEHTAVVHGTPRLVASETLTFADGRACCQRFAGTHDRIFGRFALQDGQQTLDGICFVTDFADEATENIYPYPQPSSIKTLVCPYNEGQEFGIRQSRFDVSLPAYVSLREAPGTLPYTFEGHTYYFYEDALQELEGMMAGYEVNTLILLNAPRLFGSRGEKELLDICVHPRYQWDDPGAFISAFNMTTEAGQQVYAAFVSFLARRYTRADKKYGRVGGVIISNEINLPYNWGNAGGMPVEDYMQEYTQALRLAWLSGRRYYSDFRVYLSLANLWDDAGVDGKKVYCGRQITDLLGAQARQEGDFPWHMAFHPYPESWLPDFWNDRRAEFHFATPRITYKNMEVLEAYLAQPQLLYRGKARRIIFSEQGFNAEHGPLQALQEKQSAAGYVLAFLKARQMQTVDMLANHSYIDNPREFGLNLGVFRYDENAPGHRGQAKPLADTIRAMDTPAEGLAVAFAREVIDPALFDWLLHPSVECGDPDRSKDVEFG